MTNAVPSPDVVAAEKSALRARMKAMRGAVLSDVHDSAKRALAERAASIDVGATNVSGYLPIGSELDPRPLLAALAARGARLCLPVMHGRTVPLSFRAWTPGDSMATLAWGIQEPTADRETLTPDTMLVPLLAIDRTGHRLGYGAGHYDRTITAIRAAGHPLTTIGLAFDAQIIDAVPHSDYDVPLDWILTPSGAFRCQGTP